MMATPQASSSARADGLRLAIVASRFNGAVVEKLVAGAVAEIEKRGGDRPAVLWVSGALELPLVAQRVAKEWNLNAVVCLGCVIEGGTDHYEHVCRATVDGLMRVSLDTGIPVGNGVLTVKSLAQAEDRAGGAVGNKGAEAAEAAIDAARVLQGIGR